MKTTILIIVSLILLVSDAFCQTAVIAAEKAEFGDQKNLQEYRTFYFNEPSADSSIFYKDSIVLYVNKMKEEYPRMELYKDGKFGFFYNVKLEITTKEDEETGQYITRTKLNSDTIIGDYGLIQIAEISGNGESQDAGLILIFENKSRIRYSIAEREEQIIIKKTE